MNSTTLLTLCAGLALVAPAFATVSIEWVEPAEFTDIAEDRFTPTDREIAAFTEEMGEVIEDELKGRVPEGHTLSLKVTDVDLAGEFEPWRMRAQDVRIIKDIYPPRVSFQWTLTGPDGQTVASGEEKLTDLSFTWNVYRRSLDRYPYERELWRRWGSTTLPKDR